MTAYVGAGVIYLLVKYTYDPHGGLNPEPHPVGAYSTLELAKDAANRIATPSLKWDDKGATTNSTDQHVDYHFEIWTVDYAVPMFADEHHYPDARQQVIRDFEAAKQVKAEVITEDDLQSGLNYTDALMLLFKDYPNRGEIVRGILDIDHKARNR